MKYRNQRILITGTSSQQYSQQAAAKTEAFSDAIRRIAEDAGYEVVVCQPSLSWTSSVAAEFDHVFLGISPMLSLSSNCAYGALRAVDTFWNSSNLVLFCDSPEPWKVFANLRAIDKSDASLFKEFYSRRPGYQQIASDSNIRDSIVSGVSKLLNDDWPTTLIPALPWSTDDFPGVPDNAVKSFEKFYVDSYLVHDTSSEPIRDRQWLVETHDAKWTKTVTSTLGSEWVTSRELKITAGDTARSTMKTKIGTVIGPHRDKVTWWTPRYAQSLSSNAPVITDWKMSMTLGKSWAHLASTVEELKDDDRTQLASAQKQEYMARVWNKNDTVENLRLLSTGVHRDSVI